MRRDDREGKSLSINSTRYTSKREEEGGESGLLGDLETTSSVFD